MNPPAGRDDRSLPSVAAPTAPVQRPLGPPRSAVSGPMPKTQRPEKWMTREEILAGMKSGAIGNLQSAGARPCRPPCQPPRGRLRRVPEGSSWGSGWPGTGTDAAPHRPSRPTKIGGLSQRLRRVDEEEEARPRAGRLGSSADRAGRRARRNERRRRAPGHLALPAATLLTEDEEVRRVRVVQAGPQERRSALRPRPDPQESREIEPPITVRNLSEAIGIKANDLFRKLMAMGQMATINASLDDDMALMLSMEFGVELEVVHPRTAEDELLDSLVPGASENLSPDPRSSRSWATSIMARPRSWTAFASPMSSRVRAAASPSTSARTRSSTTAADHVCRHPRSRGLHGDAGPRCQRDRHRGPGRGRR